MFNDELSTVDASSVINVTTDTLGLWVKAKKFSRARPSVEGQPALYRAQDVLDLLPPRIRYRWPVLLRPCQAAVILGRSTDTLRSLAQLGIIDCVVLPTRRDFRYDERQLRVVAAAPPKIRANHEDLLHYVTTQYANLPVL